MYILKVTLTNISNNFTRKKQVICMDLLPLSSMPASLVTKFFANGAKIPATGLVEASPSIHAFIVPSHSIHVPLELLLLPPTLPYLY